MDLLKIFKKYKFVILIILLVYFLTCSSENLSLSNNITATYNNIIKQVCNNREECVSSYRNRCIENECKGIAGSDLGNCINSCTSISLR